MLRIGVLSSGNGSNLQAILDACARGDIPAKVVVVVSDKPEAHAIARAKAAGVPAHVIPPSGERESHERKILAILSAAKVELVCLAGYMRILTPVFVRAYPGRILNVHPSLLPAFPGGRAHREVLAHGAKLSGCTIHFVDEQVDHGPIIAQSAVPVYDEDTEESLARRVISQEHKLYPTVIGWFAQGRLSIEGRIVTIRRGVGSKPIAGGSLTSPAVEP